MLRQMPLTFRESTGWFALGSALVFCSAVTACAGTSFAQKRTANVKPPAPTRTVLSKKQARVAKAPATPEPELQLERLPLDPSVENADVSITAQLKARSLLFETVPSPKVQFSGQPERDTAWEAQRENLPTPVEPGVTYRNIGIRLKITSVFRDIDRIVAEALGEIPLTEDASTNQAPTEDRAQTTSAKPPSATPSGSKPVLRPTPLRIRP
jgi:hypothetical protein